MTTHIKDLIKDFLKNKQEETNDIEKIRKIVNETLGPNFKKHMHIKRVYKNTLIFSSDNSSFSYDFNLKKGNLLKIIKKEFPYIEDIKIKI